MERSCEDPKATRRKSVAHRSNALLDPSLGQSRRNEVTTTSCCRAAIARCQEVIRHGMRLPDERTRWRSLAGTSGTVSPAQRLATSQLFVNASGKGWGVRLAVDATIILYEVSSQRQRRLASLESGHLNAGTAQGTRYRVREPALTAPRTSTRKRAAMLSRHALIASERLAAARRHTAQSLGQTNP